MATAEQLHSWKDPEPDVEVVLNHYAEGWRGVPIHYTAYGNGEPAIVCCNGVGVSTFFWKYVVRYFASQRRIVTWDYRGHNSSGLPKRLSRQAMSMAANAHDLAGVLDACKIDRAVLLGHSMGCQVILEFWRLYPERVAALVPICGPYGKPFNTFFNLPSVALPVFEVFHYLATEYPRQLEAVLRPLLRTRIPYDLARLGVINAQLAAFDDIRPYFEHLSEMNLQVFFMMAHEMQHHDAGPWLAKIAVPTLVVAGEQDLFTPLALSTEMRQRIPDSEILVLPKGSHTGLIEHPELLNLRLEKFLRERVGPNQQPVISNQ
jgi:pimeloyl-ACP methyl ester carboxylesterase